MMATSSESGLSGCGEMRKKGGLDTRDSSEHEKEMEQKGQAQIPLLLLAHFNYGVSWIANESRKKKSANAMTSM